MVNAQCLATIVTSSRRSPGQDTGLGGLDVANSGDYNLFSSSLVLVFLCLLQSWFNDVGIFARYSYIPLDLNQLLNVGVDHWLQICTVDTCQWLYISFEGLFC